MYDYEQQKLLFRKLMAELAEEDRKMPLSKDHLAERMGEIFEKAFPLSPLVPHIKRYLTE